MIGLSMGTLYTLVMASVTKRALQGEMPTDMRLMFLNHLDEMTDGTLTAEVISLVEPIDNAGYELFQEAAKLGYEIIFDPGTGRRPNAFDILYQKFTVFAELNPSLKVAYDKACRPWGGSYDSIYSQEARTST